ncbi:MAG: Flp pilus assembly protein CpaB, partial [Comamonadaceae bacterium]
MNTSMKVLAALLTVVALVLAGLAARLAMQPAAPVAAAAPAAATYPVVVTARAVPAGRAFVAADVRLEHLPVRPAGAYAETARAIGQRPALDLGEGVPVLQALTSTGLAQRVATGERAVAVRVDETIGIGHRVRPGDKVDLFLMLKQDSREVGYTQARLLLPALRVLGYGNESVDGPNHAADTPQAETQQRRDTARTAVLAVPLAQVNQLLLGASVGQLAMALRHPND